jgi:hypothetical protein
MCRKPSQKFSLIGLFVRELRSLEIEGVVVGFMDDFHGKACGI